MFARRFLFNIFISGIVLTKIFAQDCCTFTPLTVIPNISTIADAHFFSDGCYAFLSPLSPKGFVSATYNTQTCTFNPTNTVLLPYILTTTRMAAINQPGCQNVAITDTNNNLVHIYPLTNCQLGSEVQSFSLSLPREMVSSNTCLAVSFNPQELATYSIGTNCQVTLADTQNVGFNATSLAISPPTSPCSFIIGTPSSTNTFFLIPLNGCQMGTPVPYSMGTGIPVSSAISPNGKCVAVCYFNENVIRIFTINPDCTLTLLQTVSLVTSGQSKLAYSPDGLCLAVAHLQNALIFPVNPDCTLDSANVQTFPVANSFVVAISPLSACNLVAFPGSNPQQTGSFIFKRVPCGTLAVNLCCQNKIASDGNTVIKITITNTGSVPLTDIVVSDLLPSCFTLKKGTGIDWTFVPGNPVVVTFTGTLQPGQSTTIRLCVKANCDEGNVINQVAVTSPFTQLQTATCLIQI